MCKSDAFLFSDNNEKITSIYRHNSGLCHGWREIAVGDRRRSNLDESDNLLHFCDYFREMPCQK